MEHNDLMRIQDMIGGYKFKNLDLLQQAFVRRSYAMENGGEDNEVLEFIGDKVLDYAVIQLLIRNHGSYVQNGEFDEFACDLNEGQLTDIKRKLVEKRTLSSRIDILGLADYLIMGNGDIVKNADQEESVKEDLFEAILGALALDSNWNNDVLLTAVELMLDPETTLQASAGENYVSLIQEWTEIRYGDVPWFHYDKFDVTYSWNPMPEKGKMYFNEDITMQNYFQYNVLCGVKLGDFEYSFWARGKSKADARKAACKGAYKYLEEHDLLLSIKDEIEHPNLEDSISQLEILARRGYFKLPEYSFSQEHDKDGNPIWTCECVIPDENISAKASGSSKKAVKKETAYQVLREVLE